ncbi:MAG: hypothetical protein QM536_08925, partial [Chitinophagaceae bacterium]|nr:hypothetical protein [Chitinophagaceae bacterium]
MDSISGILDKIPLKERQELERLVVILNLPQQNGFLYAFLGVETESLKKLIIAFLQEKLPDIVYKDLGEDVLLVQDQIRDIKQHSIIDLTHIKKYTFAQVGATELGVQLSFSRSIIIKNNLTMFFLVDKEMYDYIPRAASDVWLASRFQYFFQDYEEKYYTISQTPDFTEHETYREFETLFQEYSQKEVTNANIDRFLFTIEQGYTIQKYKEIMLLIDRCIPYTHAHKNLMSKLAFLYSYKAPILQ